MECRLFNTQNKRQALNRQQHLPKHQFLFTQEQYLLCVGSTRHHWVLFLQTLLYRMLSVRDTETVEPCYNFSVIMGAAHFVAVLCQYVGDACYSEVKRKSIGDLWLPIILCKDLLNYAEFQGIMQKECILDFSHLLWCQMI